MAWDYFQIGGALDFGVPAMSDCESKAPPSLADEWLDLGAAHSKGSD